MRGSRASGLHRQRRQASAACEAVRACAYSEGRGFHEAATRGNHPRTFDAESRVPDQTWPFREGGEKLGAVILAREISATMRKPRKLRTGSPVQSSNASLRLPLRLIRQGQ